MRQDVRRDMQHCALRPAQSVFKYLQVFTACANSFAHGSNDVANSVGPLAAVYFV